MNGCDLNLHCFFIKNIIIKLINFIMDIKNFIDNYFFKKLKILVLRYYVDLHL